MKLLMLTRKVDAQDARAGFAASWVSALAAKCDRLHVIAWQESSAAGLPSNVTLESLSGSVLRKFFALHRSMRKVIREVDGVFCHMNPEYTIIAAPIAHWYKRRLVAWYTHRAVTWRRCLMELLADRIVTASPESFRRPYSAKKVFVLGHGIDTDHFKPAQRPVQPDKFEILTVGRISPTKRIDVMIEAVALMRDPQVRFSYAGDSARIADVAYRDRLKQSNISGIRYLSSIRHRETVGLYQRADLFINLSDTGSLDKAVLEAMACGCPVLTSNEAFKGIIPSDMFLEHADAASVAEAIKRVKALPSETRLEQGLKLREVVVRDHGIEQLASRILKQFE
jgi:glycosyltransferase involved in cell wall biosynthesis